MDDVISEAVRGGAVGERVTAIGGDRQPPRCCGVDGGSHREDATNDVVAETVRGGAVGEGCPVIRRDGQASFRRGIHRRADGVDVIHLVCEETTGDCVFRHVARATVGRDLQATVACDVDGGAAVVGVDVVGGE